MAQNRQDMAHELSWKFRRADSAFKRTIERRVRDTGVYRSQHRLLMHLACRPNCSQVELASHLEVSPAAIAVRQMQIYWGVRHHREGKAGHRKEHRHVRGDGTVDVPGFFR